LPGLTEVSLLPDAARAEGIAFDELIEILLNTALED
ncbi:MAG: D-alanine--D-alanine ligase, partial [Bacillota bacterium]